MDKQTPIQKVHFIINPAAGQPQPILQIINDELTDLDWTVDVTTALRDGASLARAAIADSTDLIAIYGGDGTVKSVINGLVNTGTPVALLHGGTGNALAHELDIPNDLLGAVRLITGNHQLRYLDVGKVTRDDAPDKPGYFILRSSIGLQNRILEQATPALKQQFGNLAYLVAGIRSLPEGRATTFHLTVDGETFDAEGLTCMVANSASVGGATSFVFAPDIDPSDGALDVFVLDSRFESVVSMMNSSLGADLSRYPNHWRGREIRVTMDEPSTVTLDGEPFDDTPITVNVIPHAIQVLVPGQPTSQ